MPGTCSVSLVLCTFNRARQLRSCIEHLLAQSPDGPPFELLIVDNNSTDETRSIVEGCIAASNDRLRYPFEPRQGLSYARNTESRQRRPTSSRSLTMTCASQGGGWKQSCGGSRRTR
jgi:GT2 family glycosyltransferase